MIRQVLPSTPCGRYRGKGPEGLAGMQEMSLCKGVLQVIETEARAQQFRRVRRVCLEVDGTSAA